MSWAAPGTGATGTALWLTYLSGSAEQAALMLTRLAGQGLLAVSFDPPGHGRRGDGYSPERLAGEVPASFRQRCGRCSDRPCSNASVCWTGR